MEAVNSIMEEVQVLPILTSEGTSRVVEVVGVEPVVVILQELPPAVLDPVVSFP